MGRPNKDRPEVDHAQQLGLDEPQDEPIEDEAAHPQHHLTRKQERDVTQPGYLVTHGAHVLGLLLETVQLVI